MLYGKSISKNFYSWVARFAIIVFSIFMLIIPWLLAVLKGSVLYDGWRHFYFIYPFFVICTVFGFRWLKQRIGLNPTQFYALVSIPLLLTVIKIIQMHPHQYVYTNQIVEKPMAGQFELDYWGLSYKEGLEWLVNHDKADLISVNFAEEPGETNLLALPLADQARIEMVDFKDAVYFMTTFREVKEREVYLQSKGIEANQEVFNIVVAKDTIFAIYDIR